MKRIKIGSGLLLINLLVVILVILIYFFPSNVLRIILGLPFVLFFPGYALMGALYPSKAGIGGIERVALSFGLSFAVVALLGLILNYTPWGIRLESLLYTTALFILIMSVVAWFRRRRLVEEGRFNVEFSVTLPGWEKSVWDRTLTIVLVLVVLGAIGMLIYVIATPKVGQKFTEFYILGQEGNAETYPVELVVEEEGELLVGVINNEYEVVDYRVEVRIDGIKNTEITGITLGHEEKWEQEVSFVPEKAGDNQKLEFLLYKDGELEPCLDPLRLWIDVKEP
jgi:uncharacterized membrane protein